MFKDVLIQTLRNLFSSVGSQLEKHRSFPNSVYLELIVYHFLYSSLYVSLYIAVFMKLDMSTKTEGLMRSFDLWHLLGSLTRSPSPSALIL